MEEKLQRPLQTTWPSGRPLKRCMDNIKQAEETKNTQQGELFLDRDENSDNSSLTGPRPA